MKPIYIASDHGGFKLKAAIEKYCDRVGIAYQDLGPSRYESADDYPDYAHRLARRVAATNGRGILCCRNGIGVSVVANKTAGIRAFATDNPAIAKTARADDDTNVLCLGQDFTSATQAVIIVKVWLKTKFTGAARHRRRLNKLKKIERRA